MSTPRWLRNSIALAVLVTSALLTAGARADAASEARLRYDRALKFYEDGVYDAALVELTRAYELNPSYRIVYNIAQTRVAMRDYAGAIESFQRYLREGGGQVPNDRVASVRAELNDLQQRVGKLTIDTDVTDGEVLVDDALVGTTPLGSPLLVNAGLRRVTVRHPDFPSHSQRVSVAGGEQLRVSLPLRPRAADAPAMADAREAPAGPTASAPAAATEPAPDVGSSRLSLSSADRRDDGAPSRTPAWVMTGVTGALAATAIVFAVVAQNQNQDLDERRSRPGEDVTAFNRDRDEMKRMALLTDISLVAAVASAGVTTWLWLRGDGAPAERAARSRGVRVALVGTSAQLRGEF